MDTETHREQRITPDAVMAKALEALVEAGFTFTEVDACPVPSCEMCAPTQVRTAA